MREVTKKMIKDYMILENGYDFMGYFFESPSHLSFHHLIVPKCKCSEYGIGDGYYEWNGAILDRDTAHNYLHMIERIERDIFEKITEVLVAENLKNTLDIECLREINNLLCIFEQRYGKEEGSNKEKIIKKDYYKRLLKKYTK